MFAPRLTTHSRRALQRLSILCSAVLMAACASGPPKPFVPKATTVEERQAAFDTVGRLIQERYVDGRHNGVDWAAVQARYRDRVVGAKDDEAHWAELNRMVAELRDAHTRVLSPMELEGTRLQKGSHGIVIEPYDGRFWLARVSGSHQAALLGLRPGQEVLQVQGVPAAAWWQNRLQEVPASSTPRAQQLLINRSLDRGKPGDTLRLQLRGPADAVREVTLRIDPGFLGSVRAFRLADGTGYLRIAGFQEGLGPEIRAAMAHLAGSERLVLDLRGNPGGSHRLTMQVLGWFLPGGKVGQIQTRDNQRLTALLGLLDVTPKLDVVAQAPRMTQPLAVLVDESSGSAAELTAGVLKAKGRARLFGATSCGCLLGVRGGGENLPGGGRLMFSEIDLLIDGLARVEGVGVVPDEPVRYDPGLDLHGEDTVLAAARRWLATQGGSPVRWPDATGAAAAPATSAASTKAASSARSDDRPD